MFAEFDTTIVSTLVQKCSRALRPSAHVLRDRRRFELKRHTLPLTACTSSGSRRTPARSWFQSICFLAMSTPFMLLFFAEEPSNASLDLIFRQVERFERIAEGNH